MASLTNLVSVVAILLLFANQQCHCRQLYVRQVPTSAPMDCSLLMDVSNPVHSLYEAAVSSNVSAVQCFITNGVNVSGQIPGGFTPIQAASNYGHLEIVRMLIRAGAQANVHDMIVGLTPLHVAIGRNFLEVATLLIDSGADINARSHLGISPLQVAVTKGHKPMVELLVNRGADLNIKDNLGNTPLHIAANRGNLPIVQLLVQKGADINATSAFGKTPADVAVHHPNVRDFLINQPLLTNLSLFRME